MREQYNPFIEDLSRKDFDGLLPTNVKPTHYDITLEPDLENASFSGSVAISFDVVEESTSILLNSLELDILTTEIVETSGNVIKVPEVVYNELRATMLIMIPKRLSAGSQIQLRQTFNGRLNDISTMSGFNRSTYETVNGESKWIASTQGQPTGMRRIFPCVDEPAAKATFSATLIVDEELKCLSNMDVASEDPISQMFSALRKKRVVFNKTPAMSSYLVAFVVAELNYIETTRFRMPIRVYATPDQDINSAQFPLDVAAHTMIQHEKSFGSPYPLPKLDMVAIPGHAGGMENWGCVLYDPKYLVRDQSDCAAFDNENIASIVAHELAHQWFGNIVTCAWWDSTWLNESFADWAAKDALTHMFPDWNVWSGFIAGHPTGTALAYQNALTLDSSRGSHPIEAHVSTPDEISEIFDAITYAKGCTVLRMIAEYLSTEVFIKGVRLHLRRHAFGNATTNDLWDSLSTASGKDVKKIMSVWTLQVGYPVLLVTEDEGSSTIKIEQHRFLQSGDVLPKDDQVLYPISLQIKSGGSIVQHGQLLGRSGRFKVDLSFYKLNTGQTGLFRVSYPLSRLQKLGDQLSCGLLSVDDRVGLISDYQALVTSGKSTQARTSDLLSFLQKFEHETSYFVWRQLLVCLRDIREAWMFDDKETRRALDRFQTTLLSKVLDKFGAELWKFKPNDSYNEQDFKSIIFSNSLDYLPVKTTATYLFDQFMSGNHRILNPNIRKAVFQSVLEDENSCSRHVSSNHGDLQA